MLFNLWQSILFIDKKEYFFSVRLMLINVPSIRVNLDKCIPKRTARDATNSIHASLTIETAHLAAAAAAGLTKTTHRRRVPTKGDSPI